MRTVIIGTASSFGRAQTPVSVVTLAMSPNLNINRLGIEPKDSKYFVRNRYLFERVFASSFPKGHKLYSESKSIPSTNRQSSEQIWYTIICDSNVNISQTLHFILQWNSIEKVMKSILRICIIPADYLVFS